MKQISTALIFFLLMSPMYLSAQGTGGFFNQQSSKTKLMIAQIAGYEIYLHEIRNGYIVAEKGLNTLRDLKGGTFNLHTSYFNSLKQVNPAIKINARAKAMAGLQQQIINEFATELAWQQKQQILSKAEIDYIQKVYRSILGKCKTDMDELSEVLTPGKLQMTDHERIERIDNLYTSMQDKQAFASSFATHCRQMATDRKTNKLNNGQIKKLYGIAN